MCLILKALNLSLSPLPVTVCTCNVRGNCRMAAKQLQGMPTVQSTVGILAGTLGVIGKRPSAPWDTVWIVGGLIALTQHITDGLLAYCCI